MGRSLTAIDGISVNNSCQQIYLEESVAARGLCNAHGVVEIELSVISAIKSKVHCRGTLLMSDGTWRNTGW